MISQIRSSLKDRVQAVDSNGGRCLIENCSLTRAIEYCHLVPLKFWDDSRVLNSLEWYWNMRAKTLNLDTRRNVFPAGASVHRMHDTSRWLIVPEEGIIERYHTSLEPFPLDNFLIAQRAQFPDIPDRNDFQYTLIPIQDMEDIAFTRQTTIDPPLLPDYFTTHLYPYDAFPILVSHVHPKFAIVSVGMQLAKLPQDKARALAEKFPWLIKIMDLYLAWIFRPLEDSMKDASFYPPYDPDDNGDPKDTATEKGRYVENQKRAQEESPTGNRPCTRASNQQLCEVDEYDEIEDSECDSLITKKGRYNGGYRKQNQHEMTGDGVSASGKRKWTCGLSQASIGEHISKVGKMEWDGDAFSKLSSQVVNEKQVDVTDMTALNIEYADACHCELWGEV